MQFGIKKILFQKECHTKKQLREKKPRRGFKKKFLLTKPEQHSHQHLLGLQIKQCTLCARNIIHECWFPILIARGLQAQNMNAVTGRKMRRTSSTWSCRPPPRPPTWNSPWTCPAQCPPARKTVNHNIPLFSIESRIIYSGSGSSYEFLEFRIRIRIQVLIWIQPIW